MRGGKSILRQSRTIGRCVFLRRDMPYLPLLLRRRIASLGRVLFAAGWLLSASAAQAQSQLPPHDSIAARAAPCMTCHGKQGRAASDGYYPRIAGKPAGYLANQLINFRDGRRVQYPLMTYLVQHLSDDYLKEMADYFAAQHPPYPPPQDIAAPAAVLERGRALVNDGDRARDVPACAACHGTALTGMLPTIPGLLGLPRDYLNAQFGAWRDGTRRAAAPDCMAQVAQRLSVEDISAVSAWLASQPAPADAKPAAPAAQPLPLRCGSFPQQAKP
jgi:cytochrome c553